MAALHDEPAGLPAWTTRPKVAAVGRPGGVMAVGGLLALDSAFRRLRRPLHAARDQEPGRSCRQIDHS